jgi:PleD family two-component response regulator
MDLHLLSSIAAYASVAIERSEYYARSEELKKISITDPLTGLLNRRYFQERLIEEMERSRRHKLPLSLIIMDVDNFKAINDTFGHQAGDEALKGIARCIRNSIRAIDVAARYGGEEFTVILPQTSKTGCHGHRRTNLLGGDPTRAAAEHPAGQVVVQCKPWPDNFS